MKMFRSTLIACVLAVFSLGASAQTVNSSSLSNQNSTSNSGANASTDGNAQVIAFNSAAQPTRTTERIEAAPAMSLGSFGVSFSSNNCSNTVAGQISIIKLGVSGGKAIMERSCGFLVQATGMGNMANHYEALREIALQHSTNCTPGPTDKSPPVCTVVPSMVAEAAIDAELQRRWEGMAGFDFCQTSDDNLKACVTMGLIIPDGHGGYKPATEAQQVNTAAIVQGVQMQNDAMQQQQQRQQQLASNQFAPQQSGPTSLDQTSVANQTWYQNATKH
jgi:hypothetical protein